MKNYKFVLRAFMALVMAASFTACSDDDTPTGGEEEPVVETHNFDIIVSIGEHGGMNQSEGTIIRRVNALTADQPMIDFTGKGVDITGTYTLEAITKGKYYYQVPESADQFVKFEIVADNQAPVVVARQPFKTVTYKQRNYTHAWLDDNTLLIMAANGDKNKIVWTKLDANDLSIIAEGTLDLTFKNAKAKMFSTSGILTYREADKKLFYFYTEKESARKAYPGIYTAVLNPSTMQIETTHESLVAEEMAGSAYGELLQNIVVYDETGTMYMACLSASEAGGDDGYLLRIKPGQTEFDPTYNGYKNPDGKLLTLQYLGNGKAFIYSRNDRVPNPENPDKFLSGVSDYIQYYSILDMNTGVRTRLQYEGQDIPYSAGRFAQRSVVVDGKVYFGVSTKEATNPCIYIYDIESGKVEKGVEISQGFYFDMIRVMDAE